MHVLQPSFLGDDLQTKTSWRHGSSQSSGSESGTAAPQISSKVPTQRRCALGLAYPKQVLPLGCTSIPAPFGSFWRQDIFSLMDIYCGITSCVVGAGDTILLWKDGWSDQQPLQDSLAHLHSFSLFEDVSIQDYSSDTDLASHFVLPLSVEASNELLSLSRSLEQAHVDLNVADTWILVWGVLSFGPRNSTDSTTVM